MVKAVLFDWGDTLMEFAYSPELVAAGHRAGLAAIGEDDRPELTEHFREEYEPMVDILPEAGQLYRTTGWREISRYNDDHYPNLLFEKHLRS